MKKILLIHGIFMRPPVLWLLAKRLRKEGYEVEIFDYPLFPTERHVIDAFMEKVTTFKPNVIIGHSMGGNIVMHQLPLLGKGVDTVICLGSPLAGSQIAKTISLGVFSKLISPVAHRMLANEVVLPERFPTVGVIAGTKSTFGFRLLFPVLSGESDGTVALSETKIPQVLHHIQMNVGHTSMLFSLDVVKQVIHFIEKGSFDASAV